MQTAERRATDDAAPTKRYAAAPSKCLLAATILAPLPAMSFPVLNDARETSRPAARKILR